MTKDPIRASEMVVIGVMCYVCSCLNVYNISFFYCLDVSSFRVVMYHRPSCHQSDINDVDNMGLYADGQFWLHRHHIMGRAVG